jgi:hypothetical protein
MNTEIKDPCVICGKSIAGQRLSTWAGGNNAEPVAVGRCCDMCDRDEVIPTRIATVTTMSKEKAREIMREAYFAAKSRARQARQDVGGLK